MTDAELDLDGFVCFSVYAVGHALNRLYKPLLDPLGLTYPQYLAMVVLWGEDRLTVGEICERLFLESSTVTPLLKRMEAAGLITRMRDEDDERQVRIHLTRRGAALRRSAREIPHCILDATGRSGASLHRLAADLAALRRAIEQRIAENRA